MQDVTMDTAVLLDRYVSAWNEADPERRRGAVGRLYADRARIVAPSVEVNSEAVLEHIGEVFARFIGSSEHRFRCAAWTAHHRCVLLRWELTAPGLPVAGSGVNMLLLGRDGRIESDYQFGEPEPAAESGAASR
jgi:hypothetical protein